jgi:hypothetical protein
VESRSKRIRENVRPIVMMGNDRAKVQRGVQSERRRIEFLFVFVRREGQQEHKAAEKATRSGNDLQPLCATAYTPSGINVRME